MGDLVTGGELIVAVDFGTTNTVAVARRAGAAPQVVSVDGAPSLPSAVLLGADGNLVVGTDALRLGRSAAHRLEPRPKSRLAEDTLLLGDTPVDVLKAVGAVLTHVCSAAARQAGTPIDHLVLTHPADWGPLRMGRLLGAAAGLAPRISLAPEPVAVAARADLPPGAAVVVVDLGGGTCDAAVVQRDSGDETGDKTGYTVLACAGLPDLGGDDLDQRIVDRVGTEDPSPRGRLRLRQDARAAKELLSRHDSALVHTGTTDVTLSRTEFEALVEPDLARVVDLATRVVRSAGLDKAALHGIHLVGGTSRIPKVTTLLRDALGLPVHPDPEPEAGVAWGAMDLAATSESGSPTRPVHAPPPRKPEAPAPHKARALVVPGVAVLAAAALVATGVLLGDRAVTGTPTAGAHPTTTPPPTTSAEPDWAKPFPAVLPGKVVRNADSPHPAVVPAGKSGMFRATGTYEGATETKIEVKLDRGEVADRAAPTGYRWVVASVVTTARMTDGLPAGDGHNVFLLDQRGQLVESVNRADEATVALCGSNQQNLPATPKGKPRTECAAFLVPAATSIRGVLYDNRIDDRRREHALLFPAALPATAPAALPYGEGTVGGPPVEVTTDNLDRASLVLADVVDTPSAYLDKPKPPAGVRLYVVRFAARASGVGSMRLSELTDALYLMDDHGLLVPIDDYVGYDQRNCPDPPEEIASGDTAAGCLVFSMSGNATVARVVYRPRSVSDKPASWRVWALPS